LYDSAEPLGHVQCIPADGRLVSSVVSLGSYRHVYVFTHIGLALGIVQAFTGGFLVVMHDDEINWPSWCLVHYPRHFRISCVRPGDPGELLELTHCMIRQNQSDLYSVSLPFPVFHASDPVTRVNCWNRYIVCREWHGFTNPYGLRSRVVTGTGTGWQFPTLQKPVPVTRV
jgi:hypothetical protein